MNKSIFTMLALVAVAGTMACNQAAANGDQAMESLNPAMEADHYLQASSSVTQCPGTAPELVAMDMTDAASGVALEANRMTVSEAGAYLIVAAPQVGREGSGPYGCFDLWLRVNGEDVANSNVQLCQDEGSMAKDVIISQGIVPLEAGPPAAAAESTLKSSPGNPGTRGTWRRTAARSSAGTG